MRSFAVALALLAVSFAAACVHTPPVAVVPDAPDVDPVDAVLLAYPSLPGDGDAQRPVAPFIHLVDLPQASPLIRAPGDIDDLIVRTADGQRIGFPFYVLAPRQ